MKSLSVAALSVLLFAGVAQAQAPAGGGPPAPVRARGPALALAVEAAQTALATCLANGDHVTALVADSDDRTIALLTGDGVDWRAGGIAASKAAAVVRYKVPSGVLLDRTKTDPALAAEIKADPNIGVARQGAIPIMVGPDFIGAVSVAGPIPGPKAEACAKAGLDKIASRLK